MKIPVPDEVKAALEQSQADMSAMRVELGEIKDLLRELVDLQISLAGLDRPHPL